MMSVQGSTGPKWKKKLNKAVFRGRDSRQERLDLVTMGRKKPEIYDVALSNFFFFPYDEKKYGPKNTMSFFDFFKVCFLVVYVLFIISDEWFEVAYLCPVVSHAVSLDI